MPNREREYLRIAELLNAANNGEYHDAIRRKAALLWGDGHGALEPGSQIRLLASVNPEQVSRKFLAEWMHTSYSVDHTIAEIQQALNRISTMTNLRPAYRALVDELVGRVSLAGGGDWLLPSEVSRTVFAASSLFALHIGSFQSGGALQYSGEGSMVTIAPPGSGKTQCNVFPNLARCRGNNFGAASHCHWTNLSRLKIWLIAAVHACSYLRPRKPATHSVAHDKEC
jgi:type IV secretion system protein VirD4